MRTEAEQVIDALTAQLDECEKAANESRRASYIAVPVDVALARDELMSRISHEIKTPLTAVLGFAHMLVARPDAPVEKRLKWSKYIKSKSEQLTRLVDNMLDLSALQAGYLVLSKRNGNLGALVLEAIDGMEVLAPGRHFLPDISAHLPEISMDVDRVSQVILNMLNNAHQLSPEDQPVEINLRHSGDTLELRVTDHGNGIEAADHDAIFEPFSARPGAGYQPGKGLWLPLARALIEAHGGRFWFEPTPNHGSTFVFSLPITPLKS